MSLPLDSIRVLDLTRLLPGGLATLMLADLGADVVKIEDPAAGDYARWMPPLVDGLSVYFRVLNRNKRSLILDLKQAEGPSVLKKLVESADVLVEGFRPDVMRRFGCDYPALKAINPRLIYCAISGWGADGPYADRSGHDLNYAALAGLLGAMENPQPPGGQMADMGGAYAALAGILAALFRRERTGEGGFVDAALFEAGIPFGMYAVIEALFTGTGGGQGGLTGGMACYRVYRARDGQAVALAALEPKFWSAFCLAVERPDLIPDYNAPERQPYLRRELDELFALATADEWEQRLQGVDCCFSRITPPASVIADPQVRSRSLFGLGEDGAPWLRSPIRLDGSEAAHRAVPGYGQHTREVLTEAGYPAAQVDELLQAGIVRQM